MRRFDLLCGICAAIAVPPLIARADSPPHWTYEGDEGPAHWGGIKDDFKTCGIGLEQSPIDLSGSVTASIGALDVAYQPTPLRILNNGHTLQVNYAPGSRLTVHGRSYEIVQFHFHTPSEHKLDGKTFSLEMHVVHRDAENNFAVVGVFFKEGAFNEGLEILWKAAPAKQEPERAVPGVSVNVATLLPSTKVFYEYLGSLTTPPCTEGVKWVVLARPNTVSATQVATFQSLFGQNARPVQQLNQRLLLENAG